MLVCLLKVSCSKAGEKMMREAFTMLLRLRLIISDDFPPELFPCCRMGSNMPLSLRSKRCLGNLILRDLNALEREILEWRVDGLGTDANIARALEAGWDAAPEDGPWIPMTVPM